MSWNNIIPWWVILMPDPKSEGFKEYLDTKAKEDGMPEAVRQSWLDDIANDEVPSMIPTKECPICLEEKPLQEFLHKRTVKRGCNRCTYLPWQPNPDNIIEKKARFKLKYLYKDGKV